jgi:ABC-2 type transport system ATP-binding protein
VALVHRPEALFLDEPTIGVDPVSRRDFWLLISQLVQQGVTLVLNTPYLDEAERCHRVALMAQGRLVACDTPAALRRLIPAGILEVRGPAAEEVEPILRRLPGVRDVQVFGDSLHVTVAPGTEPHVLQAALAGAGRGDVAVRPITPGLEDVFVWLLKGQPSGGSGQLLRGRQTGEGSHRAP